MRETQSPSTVCASWWRRAFGDDDGAARMNRARLRRCDTPAEALTVEAVHDLNARLQSAGHHPKAHQLALVSIALVHVDVAEDAQAKTTRLAQAFGQSRTTKGYLSQALSALRFQALMRATDRVDLITPLRRAMAIVRHVPINVYTLADDLYFWNENVRRKWCFQYFGASNATPKHAPEETDA